MHRNIARGFAVAALTGGFAILGATAANAIDIGDGILDDDGGLLGTGLLAGDTTGGGLPVDATLPINVSGVDVSVLDGALHGTQLGGALGGSMLGDGVAVTADQAVANLFAAVDSGDNNLLHGIVGVPVDLSGTWASVLGNPSTGGANGVVVEPELVTQPTAVTGGVLDSYITAPVTVDCVTVTVISDYLGGACTPGSEPGGGGGSGSGPDGLFADLFGLDRLLGGDALGGDLLGGNLLGDGILNLDDLLEIDGLLGGDIIGDGVLDLDELLEIDNLLGGELLGGDLGLGGDVLGGAPLGGDVLDSDVVETDVLDDGVVSDDVVTTEDGVLVDPSESGSDTTVKADAVDTRVDAPLDVSRSWASALGRNRGVVVVPDLGTSPAGFFGEELLAQLPISIDCASVVILSDYERDCAAGPTDPTVPTDPTIPVEPVDPVAGPVDQVVPAVGGAFGEEGANGGPAVGGVNAAPCIPADNTAAVDEGLDLGLIGVAALAGALAAMAMTLLTRRFGASR